MSERGGWTGEERGGRRDGADVLLGLGSYRSDGSTRRRRRWDRGESGFTLAFGGGEGRAREGGRSRVDVELNADLVIVPPVPWLSCFKGTKKVSQSRGERV